MVRATKKKAKAPSRRAVSQKQQKGRGKTMLKLKWPGKKSRTATKPLTDKELYDRIQQRAFNLYQARGASNGSDLEDWFMAEKEVFKELKIKKPSLN